MLEPFKGLEGFVRGGGALRAVSSATVVGGTVLERGSSMGLGGRGGKVR